MEGQHRFFVIAILVLFSILHSGETLKCYNCYTKGSQTCEDKLTLLPSETVDCSESHCAILKYNETDGTLIIRRTCLAATCDEAMRQDKNLKECWTCDTDLCNASASNVVSIITIIGSGLIALLLSMR
ncbi:uncharacterized protein LOC105431353 [Pogonomyrmex barbatus]|uniref:Uncharacterized protein LOC105431353 n=1 Tax=Pogonomyrmex barbatus TaxID=144034 RepID=A0A6I9WKQ8_9HYME|nr:uncharacterized protein LOC105431353 [Pogonomyrmex barbatus]